MDKIYIDDTDVLTQYGVFLIQEKGLLSPLKPKNALKYDWPDEHGLQIHHADKLLEPRKFSLNLGINNTTHQLFKTRINAFCDLFNDPSLRQLRIDKYNRVFMIDVNGSKPMNRLTHWNASLNVGVFTMNFIEPEPISRQYQITETTTSVSVSGSGDQVYTVYWGDGTVSMLDASTPVGKTVTAGRRIVIAGRVEKASSFSVSNGTLITW